MGASGYESSQRSIHAVEDAYRNARRLAGSSGTAHQRYRHEEHHWLTFHYGGHDPGVCARNLDAMELWLLDSDAQTLLGHASVLHALVDHGSLPEIASSYANGFRANALVLGGDLEAGLALMLTNAPIWQEFWGGWCFPLDSALGTALALAGNTPDAIDHVEARLDLANESGAHWWDPEFHRVLGELVRTHDPADVSRAEECFQKALDEARQQESRFLEVRTAPSLARLYRDTSRSDEALDQINASCNPFPADTQMTDLGVARALLDELTRM